MSIEEARVRPAGYPRHYAVRSVDEQVAILHQCFPTLSSAAVKVVGSSNVPRGPFGAEGRFVLPQPEQVAHTYQDAVQVVLTMLAARRPLRNWLRERTTGGILRPAACTTPDATDSRNRTTTLVLLGQSGRRFRGLSPSQVRKKLGAGEFCLGAFAVGCILLTHPHRLSSDNDLWIDCSGDEYSRMPGDEYRLVPYFGFASGALQFDVGPREAGGPQAGSASAFAD